MVWLKILAFPLRYYPFLTSASNIKRYRRRLLPVTQTYSIKHSPNPAWVGDLARFSLIRVLSACYSLLTPASNIKRESCRFLPNILIPLRYHFPKPACDSVIFQSLPIMRVISLLSLPHISNEYQASETPVTTGYFGMLNQAFRKTGIS